MRWASPPPARSSSTPGAERYIPGTVMKPRTKFLIGGAVIVGVGVFLAVSATRETGQFYLTPTELVTRDRADPTFRNAGVKVGARVVPGSIDRKPGGRDYAFRVTDGAQILPVVFHGL